MSINWTIAVDIIKALAWPIVAAIGLYLLRRPLVELVLQIARRARKFSVFQVSVELATLPELRPLWSAGGVDPRRLSSTVIFDNPSEKLFNELLRPAQADYAIVDLSTGNAWLTSRLFIFALVLGEVTGLRAFVFLESAAGTRRRFLGVAPPTTVRRALGKRYPWLEEAFARALRGAYPAFVQRAKQGESAFSKEAPFTAGEPGTVVHLVKRFVEELQRTTSPPIDECESYLEIGTQPPIWERAHWIDGERLERDLGGVLESASVEDSPDSQRSLLTEAVLRRNASFVALVESDRRFVGLVDRHSLLGQISMMRTSAGGKADQSAS